MDNNYIDSLREGIIYHLTKTQGLGLTGVTTIKEAVNQGLVRHIYKALALSLRDKIMDKWIATNNEYREKDVKQLYYLSAEYLTGRFLGNNLINLCVEDEVKTLLGAIGLTLNDVEDMEMDAGLGNGGLGRLAACFLDSLATMELPGHGYGLRYDYGIFRQEILDGYQVEHPDEWLCHGNPWEIKREEDAVVIKFGGHTVREDMKNGKGKSDIVDYEKVVAIPFDTPVSGYNNGTVNTLRLWSTSVPDYNQFDISAFDKGDYGNALKDVLCHDDLTMVSVLYPNDNHDPGKRLRLKQQYVLVSASIQDVLRKFKKNGHPIEKFHEKSALQINDTHPSLVITELMRLLVDEEGVEWENAWDITIKSCGYTNHTVMKEALEQWDAHMLQGIMPRNYEIIEIINHDFCEMVFKRFDGDMDRVRRMSIIENGKVKMANLAVVGSHSVNGVAELHTSILKNHLLSDFDEMFPERFNNKTNGITQRKWILNANPDLARLITGKIGGKWVTDLSVIKELEKFADDETFLTEIMEIKRRNKKRLQEYINNCNPVKSETGNIVERIDINIDSIFDVQAKRLHEYKRQLMNALYILMLYNELKEDPGKSIVPRTFLFAAKSAAGYEQAKSIIKFINVLASMINHDSDVNGRIKIVFLENYNVSIAEKLLTSADISEQISTAGLEASGTGNMKLALNGALTIGTMDGANVEMSEEIGVENMFIFGMGTEEVHDLNVGGYNPADVYNNDRDIQKVMRQLCGDELTNSPSEMEVLRKIYHSLEKTDRFYVLKDLRSYKDMQENVSALYTDKMAWAKMVVLNIARMGKFSSDRTIRQYNDDIWHLENVTIAS